MLADRKNKLEKVSVVQSLQSRKDGYIFQILNFRAHEGG